MSKAVQILIVEDDVAMNNLLRDFLARQGYSVITSHSVAGALSIIRELPNHQSPDLILSDIFMGSSSGLDLVRKLKSERPEIPAILFSGFEDLEAEALKTGASRFLRKPFGLAKLAQLVREELQKKQPQTETA